MDSFCPPSSCFMWNIVDCWQVMFDSVSRRLDNSSQHSHQIPI
jgi:hypothetical protein